MLFGGRTNKNKNISVEEAELEWEEELRSGADNGIISYIDYYNIIRELKRVTNKINKVDHSEAKDVNTDERAPNNEPPSDKTVWRDIYQGRAEM